jgi:hypothetical protein
MFTVDARSAGHRRVADIFLTLIASKPKFTNHPSCPLQEVKLEGTVSQPV